VSRSLAWLHALAWIRRIEGAFVDDPDDPGGATFCGVSLRVVKDLDSDRDGRLDFDLDGDGDVDRHDIEKLRDHPDKVSAFYNERYWASVRGPELPSWLALFAFDAAVHHGVKPAIVLLQRGLGVHADGIIGGKTLRRANTMELGEALESCLAERAELFGAVCRRRERKKVAELLDAGVGVSMAGPQAEKYGWKYFKGWSRRLFMLDGEARNR
jgi:lysozyme family protein